jgi:drug/metabolite transporter (DMT)-like permease
VPYLLAIVSAALYGGADFLGGLSARQASVIAVVTLSQASGLVALLIVLPLLPQAAPSSADLFWGTAAGAAGGVGVALLYRALALGTMAVVAPTTAVCAVIIPVVAGALTGEQTTKLTALGIALAMFGIVLVSQQTRADAAPRAVFGLRAPGIWHALASGVAIGVFFLGLARTGAAAGLWPLVGARAASVAMFAALAAARGQSLRLGAPVIWIVGCAGAIDMAANACYLVATRAASLSVVVTLASLYPASTVLLARVLLGERLNTWQTVGVVCALVAIGLIVGGDAGPFSLL